MSAYAAVKALHILGLIIWCAGLLVIPTLYRLRSRVGEGAPLHDLHRFTRAMYVGVTSPAAFVAVGTGTGLIFLGNVFTIWMFLKLGAVGALVLLHIRAGFVILHLFEHGGRYGSWRQMGITAATLGVVATILVLVLAKPHVDATVVPYWLREPGSLQSLSEIIIPTP